MPLPPLPQNPANGPFVVSFLAASLPAIGAKIYRVKKENLDFHSKTTPGGNVEHFPGCKERAEKYEEIHNGEFSVLVESSTGKIRRIGSHDIDDFSTWGYYTSFDSTKDATHYRNDDMEGQNSGAYVFRPSTPTQELHIVEASNATILKTEIGTEIHKAFKKPWISTITRIFTGMPFIEIEYQVGPIPVNDGRGKEVVTRYQTLVRNKGTFYTDSNGRHFLKRRRNQRPTWNVTVFEPIAGNYYPVNTAIYVDETVGDKKSSPAFAVVTDRTQGGSSIVDGTVELMVHRRTLVDDGRGVGEAMNETDSGITPCAPFGNADRIGEGLITRGKHRIIVENHGMKNYTKCSEGGDTTSQATCGGTGGARLARSHMDAAFASPLVFVATAKSTQEIPFQRTKFSDLRTSLPNNIMLITKKRLVSSKIDSKALSLFLVRLGHQYGPDEDPNLSLPVKINLADLFPHGLVKRVFETTLSGNRDINDWKQERFDWSGSSTSSENKGRTQHRCATNITLTTLDIRTFIVHVDTSLDNKIRA